MKSTLTVTSILRDLRDDVRIAKNRVDTVRRNTPAIKKDLELVRSIAKLVKGVRSYINAYTFRGNVACNIALMELQSIKNDPLLLKVLERALDVATPSSTNDYVSDWAATRDFEFMLPNGGKLTIEARLADNAASCQRVKIGTKLVEEATYELVCN